MISSGANSLPVIALLGRPNVGKSTLFNRLTQTRDALVFDVPGLTRDRQYGDGRFKESSYWVIDTGGLIGEEVSPLKKQIEQQVEQAIDEADILFFIVDSTVGLHPSDTWIAARLRSCPQKLYLLVNKVDRNSPAIACSEFYALGLNPVMAISAQRGYGLDHLMENALSWFAELASEKKTPAVTPEADAIEVAIVGRPNVGKSTLINHMVGEKRLVVFDGPGTTRDVIKTHHQRGEKRYVLVDTAGVRRLRTDVIEKFSVIKTLKAIQTAQIVIFVIDVGMGLGGEDRYLLGKVLTFGKGLVLGFNKWDQLKADGRVQFKRQVARQLLFVNYAPRCQISAVQGTGLKRLYAAMETVSAALHRELKTGVLNQILKKALSEHPPPLGSGGRRIKLRYAHCIQKDPLTIMIHGKQTSLLSVAYQRYLSRYFREALHLVGIPVLICLKDDFNPYVVSAAG